MEQTHFERLLKGKRGKKHTKFKSDHFNFRTKYKMNENKALNRFILIRLLTASMRLNAPFSYQQFNETNAKHSSIFM